MTTKKNTKATKKGDDNTFTRKQVRDLIHEIINFSCDRTQDSIVSLMAVEEGVKLNKDQAEALCKATTASIRDAAFTVLASKQM